MTPARRGSLLTLVAVVVLALAAVALSRWGTGPEVEAPATPTVTSRATTAAPARTATTTHDPESGLAYVDAADLPRQAQTTIRLIDAGGPFPYAKDGVTFRNAEGVLPAHPRGWYREYTVPTPEESDRGARRIVAGDRGRQLFYTGDHYRTFARVRR